MTAQPIAAPEGDRDWIDFTFRRCWVKKANRRQSSQFKPFDEPCYEALVLEGVIVRKDRRRQGVFARFLAVFIAAPGFDLYVVEAVQNPHLAEYLIRLGWDCDASVMDFFWPPEAKEK